MCSALKMRPLACHGSFYFNSSCHWLVRRVEGVYIAIETMIGTRAGVGWLKVQLSSSKTGSVDGYELYRLPGFSLMEANNINNNTKNNPGTLSSPVPRAKKYSVTM
jgi:hypothetical protein